MPLTLCPPPPPSSMGSPFVKYPRSFVVVSRSLYVIFTVHLLLFEQGPGKEKKKKKKRKISNSFVSYTRVKKKKMLRKSKQKERKEIKCV